MSPAPAGCPSRVRAGTSAATPWENSVPSPDTHHEHEHGVEDERHGAEGLDGGHHVPLQAQGKHNAQGDGEEQDYAEAARHLQRDQQGELKHARNTPGKQQSNSCP